jgi:hypothetical protein
MKIIEEFSHGDGSHCGLADWYPEKEKALAAALAKHKPFDTGWYGSKKEIASARIRSEDGIKLKIEVSVSDDLDTGGLGYASISDWTPEAVSAAIYKAWDLADHDQEDNEPYIGFSVLRKGSWVECYLISDGSHDLPPGDNYRWWGWQYDEKDEAGIPDPDIPLPAVAPFELWAQKWAYGNAEENSLVIGDWKIKPWRENPPAYEDPNDYVGMGWVGSDGRP